MTLLPAKVDIIVIGSGMGGLTSAALLAKAGQQVLVLEQHDRAGGYVHGFKRKRYRFDAGVHITSGCGNSGFKGGQIIRKVLQTLEVYEELEFLPVDPFATISIADKNVMLPATITACVEQLGALFPDQKQGLQALLELCLALAEQVAKADDIVATDDLAYIHSELNLLFKYRRSTLADVWGEYIQDEHLQSLFAALWPYLGLPPKQVSFVYWASMLMGYMEDGAYYCRGGFQGLANALVNGLQKAGGQIVYNCAAAKIHVHNNQVHGVELTSGDFIAAKKVISNADMLHTVFQLIGTQHFKPAYLQRLQSMQASLSIFVVYIATNLNVEEAGAHHEAFYYDVIDHEQNYQLSTQGDLSWISITIPTLLDHSLAPAGEHLVMLTTLTNYDKNSDWKEYKQLFADKMLNFAERKIPGLKQHILFMDSGSPATMQRYTLNHKGAAYGWAASPEQIGANRICNQAPISGLYFAGHWTTPGGGVYGASYSGMQTAQTVLGLKKQELLWQLCTSDE